MSRRRGSFARGLVISLAVFFALMFGGIWLVNYVGRASTEAETTLVRDAVQRAALTCYAVEGGYPPDLDYLKQNYGLVYDEENYFIYYEAFAVNVLPEIHVTEKGAGM